MTADPPMTADMTAAQLSESEFRARVQKIFGAIDRSLAEVDPDVAECEVGLGTLTITLKDGSRCILSQQPSIRQVWMAVASRGVAYHFSWVKVDGVRQRWVDQGKNVELVEWLQQYLNEVAGLRLALQESVYAEN